MNKKYEEDLKYFLKCADTNHVDFYFTHTKEELDKFITKYLEENKIENDYDFVYMMKNIIKYANGLLDSHTNISINDDTWLPLVFKYIDGNFYIDRCNKKGFIKSKLLSINGIPIDKIIYELKNTISYIFDGWLIYQIEGILGMSGYLKILPSIDESTKEIIYETSNGKLIYPIKDYSSEIVYPEEDNENILIRDDILIIKYRACVSIYVPNISIINNILKENNINKIVLDIRGNTGGSSSLIEPFLKYLKDTNLSIYTLVDKAVFSSGLFCISDMKNIGSKIIGEELGTPMNHFGYTDNLFKTPNTNLEFHFSNAYWAYEYNTFTGIYNKDEILNKKDLYSIPIKFKLDKCFNETKEEYLKTNDDILLEKCITYIKDDEA